MKYFLQKNGNDYDFTLTLSLTVVELGHITACIEYIYPTDSNIQTRVTGTTVFVGATRTSENAKQKFVRIITQLDNNIRESNNAFSVNFKGTSTDSNPGYIVVYGKLGIYDDVEPRVFDRPYAALDQKMSMQTNLDMNGYEISKFKAMDNMDFNFKYVEN